MDAGPVVIELSEVEHALLARTQLTHKTALALRPFDVAVTIPVLRAEQG